MKHWEKSVLVTGGAGFIGSHVIDLFVHAYPAYRIVNLDLLTYSGNLENLSSVREAPNYAFVRGDIGDRALVEQVFLDYAISHVIHLAAESHVDRSIEDPLQFIRTNVLGTGNLLDVARRMWPEREGHLFYHISTDEVYGSLGETGYFREDTPYDPRSPYSASKAGSDHLVRAFHHTYGLPTLVSNCSNNYGPYQFPEKLIPLIIHNIRENKPLPVYGDGSNVRDWLWVKDHARAIDVIFHRGKPGETYNIGGNNEQKNIDLVRTICRLMDEYLRKPDGTSASLITYVKDRPGHDHRYAIDAGKLKRELGWEPATSFEEGIRETIEWYLGHEAWLKGVTSGDYLHYYEKQYGNRG